MIDTRIEVWHSLGDLSVRPWRWQVRADVGGGICLEASGSEWSEEDARNAARFAAEWTEEVAHGILGSEDVR
jgi:hypothetical protein